MPITQIKRLQKDSAELLSFQQKILEEGDIELAKKIKAKKKFLDKHIASVLEVAA